MRKRGYVIVRQMFDADEVAQIRTGARERIAEMERAGRTVSFTGPEGTAYGGGGDLLVMPRLRHLVYDPRVVSVAEQLLGGKPIYFGDSGFSMGKSGIRGWHRDNANRRRWPGGPDWHNPPYPLVRCGIYPQDQSRHSGGLALRPHSHRPGLVRPTLPKLVDASAGDMIVWNLRTVHSGEVVRLRGLPWLPLHPRLQTYLPEALRVPDHDERILLSVTFARAGEHLDHYIEHMQSRGDWKYTPPEPEVWTKAEDAGLQMLAPTAAPGAQRERRDGDS
jgi:hypothetical protein